MKNKIPEQLFDDTYANLLSKAESFISKEVKKYVDENIKLIKDEDINKIIRKAIMTGYWIRLVEEKMVLYGLVKQKKLVFKNSKLSGIISTADIPINKLQNIVNYFDSHDLIGLGLPVKNFIILPPNELNMQYILYTDSLIRDSLKKYKHKIKNIETFSEAVYRN